VLLNAGEGVLDLFEERAAKAGAARLVVGCRFLDLRGGLAME
jgi:hypothetical protein